jgi:hypothetical protein
MVSDWVLIGPRHQEWSQEGKIIAIATGPPEKVQLGFRISVLGFEIRIDQKWISKSKLIFQLLICRWRHTKLPWRQNKADVVKANCNFVQVNCDGLDHNVDGVKDNAYGFKHYADSVP